MRAALISIVLCAAVASPRSAWPQQGRATVRGAVRTATGERIPYAVVALEPGYPRRFADDSGNFGFTRVASGTYHLLARQVGYKPLDTTVVVRADSTLTLRLELEHLVVELTEINVTAELARQQRPERCTAPGPPDPAKSPDLAAIFDQLKQNAERYWMLADSYPVLYQMMRQRGYRDDAGKTWFTTTDTLDLRTDARWHYAPGRLVSDQPGPHGRRELQVKLPTLPDLADSTFDANHCFRLAGLDTIGGEMYVRIDFRPAETLIEPDADGSAYLDPITYVIQRIRIQLTHPDRAVVGLVNLVAGASFREVAPSIVLVGTISSESASMQGQQLVQGREEQRLLSVHFLRPLPHQQSGP